MDRTSYLCNGSRGTWNLFMFRTALRGKVIVEKVNTVLLMATRCTSTFLATMFSPLWRNPGASCHASRHLLVVPSWRLISQSSHKITHLLVLCRFGTYHFNVIAPMSRAEITPEGFLIMTKKDDGNSASGNIWQFFIFV